MAVAGDRLMVPRLTDEPSAFRVMCELRQTVETMSRPAITIDFTNCSFVRHTGVAFLGGLIRLAQARGHTIRIDWSTVRDHVMTVLQQNGFAAAFGAPLRAWIGNAVPYREDRVEDGTGIMLYLEQYWLGRNWVNISRGVLQAIQGRVWEIYANGFEHSASPVGIFTCGQHYARERRLGLCVVDFGVGIPAMVRDFLKRPWMRAQDALKWAFESGTSTAKDLRKGRGMGLNILKEFVRLNHGRLSIHSDGAHAVLVGKGNALEETFRDVPQRFRGTIVDIRFVCDDSMYVLQSEVSSAPLF